ncbi:hypothetical protein ARTHRO9AX_200079 [Arthrobacter sp. 9AX]|nr:hypothetical protein ARTHRO9AX_200079 [Arthrobacter sp. 9AX]
MGLLEFVLGLHAPRFVDAEDIVLGVHEPGAFLRVRGADMVLGPEVRQVVVLELHSPGFHVPDRPFDVRHLEAQCSVLGMFAIRDGQQLQHGTAVGAEEFASVISHSAVRESELFGVEPAGALRIIDWQDGCDCVQSKAHLATSYGENFTLLRSKTPPSFPLLQTLSHLMRPHPKRSLT